MNSPARFSPDGLHLLCVDMQPVFLKVIADRERVQRRCAFALAAATGLGLPVLFTEQAPQKLGGTAPELTALAPAAPVCAKETFSALADAGIAALLRRPPAAAHLLLCGIETSVCIAQTAFAALDSGLQVTVLTDAVGARRPGDAAAVLAALAQSGCRLLPAETVFYALVQNTRHPFFKAYTRLVKDHGP